MTIDITKITPEKLAEMNDTLMVDNTHLRDTVASLRKQVATHEQSLTRLRNQVLDEAINVAWNHEPDCNGPIEMALRKLKEPE